MFLYRVLLLCVFLWACNQYFFRSGPVFNAEYKLFGLNPPPQTRVVGFAKREFEPVKHVMQNLYNSGHDLGSQFSAFVDGELVLDLASGFTDKKYATPYTPFTLQQVFSCSKFVTSVVFFHLLQTNRIDLDKPVAHYWPQFAEGNKSHVTVGMLLQHRGGVAYLDADRVPSLQEMIVLESLANKIAGQPHNFKGQEKGAYHAVTWGWYLNEVVHRATGKTIRKIMYEEILPVMNRGRKVEHFGVPEDGVEGQVPYEFHFGVPPGPKFLTQSVKGRIAPLDSGSQLYRYFHVFIPAALMKFVGLPAVPGTLLKAVLMPFSTAHKALLASGPAFTGVKIFPWSYNDPTCRKSESPSFNGLTNARTLAKLAELVRRSQNSSTRGFVSNSTFAKAFQLCETTMDDVIGRPVTFTKLGIGFFTVGFGMGSKYHTQEGTGWYGWAGAGGSIVLFSVTERVSLAFTVNFSQLYSPGDLRSWQLIDRVMKIVSEQRKLKETGARLGKPASKSIIRERQEL